MKTRFRRRPVSFPSPSTPPRSRNNSGEEDNIYDFEGYYFLGERKGYQFKMVDGEACFFECFKNEGFYHDGEDRYLECGESHHDFYYQENHGMARDHYDDDQENGKGCDNYDDHEVNTGKARDEYEQGKSYGLACDDPGKQVVVPKNYGLACYDPDKQVFIPNYHRKQEALVLQSNREAPEVSEVPGRRVFARRG